MRSWPRSTERLLGVSARLLSGASVLTTIGVGLALRMSWQQAGQNYGPDGPLESNVPFDQRLTMVMLELGYRQLGVQLLLAAALVGAAVVALHRNPSWAQVRLVRWEVLGAGVLALAFVVALIVGNLNVMMAPDDAPDYMGPQSMTELTISNLPTLVASVLTLAAAGLWWLRLEPVADSIDEDLAEDPADDPAEKPRDDLDASVAQGAAVSPPAPARTPLDPSDNLGHGAAMGYPQDWSPEDFRPPR